MDSGMLDPSCRHISIDIESLGEVILSIGACEFDVTTGEISKSYYEVLSIDEQCSNGLQIDGRTFKWWLMQNEEARKAVAEPAVVPVEDALTRLHDFIAPQERNVFVWAYPTTFDLSAIARVCKAFDMRVPWVWPMTLDARTLYRLAISLDPEARKFEEVAGIEHHALDDAKQQAQWVVKYLASIRRSNATQGISG